MQAPKPFRCRHAQPIPVRMHVSILPPSSPPGTKCPHPHTHAHSPNQNKVPPSVLEGIARMPPPPSRPGSRWGGRASSSRKTHATGRGRHSNCGMLHYTTLCWGLHAMRGCMPSQPAAGTTLVQRRRAGTRKRAIRPQGIAAPRMAYPHWRSSWRRCSTCRSARRSAEYGSSAGGARPREVGIWSWPFLA